MQLSLATEQAAHGEPSPGPACFKPCRIERAEAELYNHTWCLQATLKPAITMAPTFGLKTLAALSAALSLATPVAAGCPSAFGQAFNPYQNQKIYSKDDVMRDFTTTKGPYKMIDGGDEGNPFTKVQGQMIEGKYPKGTFLDLLIMSLDTTN
jgi:hypothetical protein